MSALLTTRDALVKALHPECGYQHGGYDGPCGHFADALIASGAVVDAAALADEWPNDRPWWKRSEIQARLRRPQVPGELHAMNEHACATCADCLHNGLKCCGCYDGACCRANHPDYREEWKP